MKILFVFPNNAKVYGVLEPFSGKTPPIQIGIYLGAFKGADLGFYDMAAQEHTVQQGVEEIHRLNPENIIICTDHLNSGDVSKLKATEEVVRALHWPAHRLFLEGIVPTAHPEWVKPWGVTPIHGEAFETIAILLDWHQPYERLANPDWSFFNFQEYRNHYWTQVDGSPRTPYGVMYASVKCPFNCSFCNVNSLYGAPGFDQRKVESVVKELDYLVHERGLTHIRITDNIFPVNPKWIKSFCETVIQKSYAKDLYLKIYGRVEPLAKNLWMLPLMRAAGIRWVSYGIESANQNVRNKAVKPTLGPDIETVIRATREARIGMVGNFIFGLEEDTIESMEMNLIMAKDYCFDWINFNVAIPYPGTPWFFESVKEGWIPPTTWDGYAQLSVNVKPKGTKTLPPKEVIQFRDYAYENYFQSPEHRAYVTEHFGEWGTKTVNEMLAVKLVR